MPKLHTFSINKKKLLNGNLLFKIAHLRVVERFSIFKTVVIDMCQSVQSQRWKCIVQIPFDSCTAISTFKNQFLHSITNDTNNKQIPNKKKLYYEKKSQHDSNLHERLDFGKQMSIKMLTLNIS